MRDQKRAEIIAVKENRRIHVGNYLTFLFENRQTMVYQVQEMMRAEAISDEQAIEHEIKTYNQLVPGKNELKATLLIEFADPDVRRVKLNELVGLQEHVKFVIDDEVEVGAEFDQKQIETQKLSSVQYVTFEFSEEAAERFNSSEDVKLVTTHPACSYDQPLSDEQLAALKADLPR